MKSIKRIALFLIICFMAGSVPFAASAQADTIGTVVQNLTVNYTENPISVEAEGVVFGWQMENSISRDVSQTAYRIMVASSEENLKKDYFDMWDSGKVASDVSVAVPYGGKALKPTHRYFWQVKVWDNKGAVVTSSQQAFFETNLGTLGWDGAKWIGESDYPGQSANRYTVELDFVIHSESAGIAFGATDASSFFMWQINSKNYPGRVYLRPHIRKNGSWVVLPSGSNEKDITEAIGYSARDIIGKKIHMKITVNDNVVDICFGNSTTSAYTYTYTESIPAGKIAFRQFSGSDAYEVAGYDNIVVKNHLGEVLFKEDFSDSSNPNFSGGIIENGMLVVGRNSTTETIVVQNGTDTAQKSAPMLRKAFSTATGKVVKSARVYATSAGIYELYLNGEKVGKDYFNPGWTDYNKRIFYQTFDVTSMVQNGKNAMGAMLGKGWYCGNVAHVGENRFGTTPAFLAKLVVEYTDGSKNTFVTDESWLYNGTGPITDNNFLDGEKYDATREIDGWHEAEFIPDSTWIAVNTYTAEQLKIGEIVPQVGETVQQIATLTVKAVTEPKENAFIYDFGQNFAGVVRLNIPGEFAKANPGLTISLRHGEMLNDASGTGDDVEGSLYDENLRTFKAIDTYKIKGDPGGEVYTPRFTYHGFRYVEITGTEEPLPADWVTGIVLSNSLEPAGSLTTSDALVNRLYSNVEWGLHSNFMSVPTDCPQRNERMGWTGDAQIFARTATYLKNSDRFYNKYMGDMLTSQRTDGAFSNVSPGHNVYLTYYSNGWGDAGVIIPWQIYQQYGDTQIIRDTYPAMKGWVDLLAKNSNGYIRPAEGFGDWLSVETTDSSLTNTGYFAYSAYLLSEMAQLLGETEDAAYYKQLSENVKSAWRNRFLNADGWVETPTQTACIVALQFDLAENENQRKIIAAQLVDNIKRNNMHLAVGFVGVSYLCPVLSEMGYDDVAYALIQQETYPSWLYSVNQGATTIWERWNSYTKESGFGPVSMNSFNHYSYGSVAEWMYRYMLGIEKDEKAVSYKHFILQPTIGGTITSAKGYYDSVYGRIESGWNIQNGTKLTYTATVPANTTATLYLPVQKNSMVTESGKDVLTDVPGVEFVAYANGRAQINLKSGTYTFESTVTNTAVLRDALAKAESYSRFFYTPDSFAALSEAITRGEAVVADKNATDEDIANAVNVIQTAVNGLQLTGEDGSPGNPYVISEKDDLIAFADAVNRGNSFRGKYVVLETDVDLSDISWEPIGTNANWRTESGFAGHFDGRGHVVSGVTVQDAAEYSAFGLFGVVNGIVENLGVADTVIKSGSVDCRSGGLAGCINGGAVRNCYVVRSDITATSRVAGGIAGENCGGMVENCFVLGNTLNGARVGGVVGDNISSGTVKNCYSDSTLTSTMKGTIVNSKILTLQEYTDGTLLKTLNMTVLGMDWTQGAQYPVINKTPASAIVKNEYKLVYRENFDSVTAEDIFTTDAEDFTQFWYAEPVHNTTPVIENGTVTFPHNFKRLACNVSVSGTVMYQADLGAEVPGSGQGVHQGVSLRSPHKGSGMYGAYSPAEPGLGFGIDFDLWHSSLGEQGKNYVLSVVSGKFGDAKSFVIPVPTGIDVKKMHTYKFTDTGDSITVCVENLPICTVMLENLSGDKYTKGKVYDGQNNLLGDFTMNVYATPSFEVHARLTGLTFDNFSIWQYIGKPVIFEKSGDKIKIVINKAYPNSYYVIFALYKDKCLAGCRIHSRARLPLSETFTGYDEIACLVWKDFLSITPLTERVTFTG